MDNNYYFSIDTNYFKIKNKNNIKEYYFDRIINTNITNIDSIFILEINFLILPVHIEKYTYESNEKNIYVVYDMVKKFIEKNKDTFSVTPINKSNKSDNSYISSIKEKLIEETCSLCKMGYLFENSKIENLKKELKDEYERERDRENEKYEYERERENKKYHMMSYYTNQVFGR
jgi:hypothetical protein